MWQVWNLNFHANINIVDEEEALVLNESELTEDDIPAYSKYLKRSDFLSSDDNSDSSSDSDGGVPLWTLEELSLNL